MSTLIAYYSQSQNTKKIAEYIASFIEADVFEIVPVEPYAPDIKGAGEQFRKQLGEMAEGKYPEVKDLPENLDKYDTVFIGSPNWGNTLVPVVSTFIRKYDFAGKKVAPFCTHGTKGAYKVNADIVSLCANAAETVPGFGAYSQAMDEKTQTEVKFWLMGNGFLAQQR